jgi:hypothetical protein
MRRALWVNAVFAITLAGTASSHPLDLGYLTISEHGDRIDVQLDLDAGAAAAALGASPDTLDSSSVSMRAGAIAAATLEQAPITSNGAPCAWSGARATLAARTVTITDSTTCPGAQRAWQLPLVGSGVVSPRFQLLVKETGAGERLTTIDRTSPHVELAAAGATGTGTAEAGFGHFVAQGIEHIGVAPSEWRSRDGGVQLPDGIDHIMFLLALMLGGGTLLQLIGIATGFTLGHSVTLALAALDIVRPPSSIIEPLIALTIALAAIEAFTGKLGPKRWKIAAGFGLIHGFAFATALSHLELSTRGKVVALFGYNIGVELGQVAVVLIVAPLVMLAHRHAKVGRPITKAAAVGIFGCAVYWIIIRAAPLFA